MARLRSLLFIVIGLAIGAGLGLYLGWVVWPTEFTNANPSVLQESYRHDYVAMIADAYAADGNLATARQRAAKLGPDSQDIVLAATLDVILRGEDTARIRRFVRLAADLGLSSPAMTPYLSSGSGEAAP